MSTLPACSEHWGDMLNEDLLREGERKEGKACRHGVKHRTEEGNHSVRTDMLQGLEYVKSTSDHSQNHR